KDGMRRVSGSRGHNETLLFHCFPNVFEMAVTAGPFISEITRIDILTFGDQGHTVFRADFVAAHRFISAIPNTEDDSALSLAVHLHSEIATVPATSHVKCPNRIFDSSDLAIESFYVGEGCWIREMHGGGVAPRLK